MLRPAYDESDGRDGFISFECTPDLADDTQATIEQAIELWARIDRPNVMIKVPATEAGIPAIEELTARGVNVNITLLFSLARYEQVIDAYLAGLERRLEAGERVDAISSVASFFVSRVDAKADPLLPAGSELRGRVAIANAHRAYARYRERFADDRWLALREAGARPQRPLWASTGTKDPSYSDVLYVEELIAPEVINTMPEATLRAFADHGNVGRALSVDAEVGRRDAPPGRGARESTSVPSRRHWNARECAPSATPTTSCSTASRQRRRGSPPRARLHVGPVRPICTLVPASLRRRPLGAWFARTSAGPSDRSHASPLRATLDRVLELFERRKLSATELRVLLALLDRGACLSDLAEALDQRPDEITRAGRSLSMRGLMRWHHVGRRKETRLEITSSGLTTVRALLTAAGATSAAADRPEAAAGAPQSIRSRRPTAVAA